MRKLSCGERFAAKAHVLWTGVFCALFVMLLTSKASAVEISETEMQNRRCYNCHGQARIGEMAASERATMVRGGTAAATQPTGAARPGLYFTSPMLGGVHQNNRCVDCHKDAQNLPHDYKLAPASCNPCHAKPMEGFMASSHAKALARGDANAPTCKDCHGTHNILPHTDRHAMTYPLNLVQVCANCHQKHQPISTMGATRPGSALERETRGPVQEYLDSTHGKAVVAGGLAVAATCADCHSPHKVLPAKDPESTINRQQVPDTCGKCHVGLSEIYEKSVHGQLLAKGDANAPVCTDCHAAHGITRTDIPAFKLDIVNGCGTCHDKKLKGGNATLYESYRRSYHGQATQLGFDKGARCSDCHGAHDIRRVNDPESHVMGENRVATCKKCHEKADARFAAFHPHADYRDRERYPLLWGVWMYFVIMMSLSFGFFGIHCILWFIRSVIDRVKHGPHPRPTGPGIKRFNRIDRINHAFVIISFFGLTITGMPLLFADKAWAKALASMLGGVHAAGLLHRFFAIMLIMNFVVHGFGVMNRIRKYGFFNLIFGPNTMMMTPKDAKTALGMFRWFFFGGKKPKLDRWTYWEKFDYMAEVGGSGIIGGTGLLLWFPVFFSKFLPGWIFNVATVIHGYEAMLAIGFIFTIHFFNAHLRLEKFPVDDVMFTGQLPEDEFKHEREAEYERLVATGELDKLRVPPAPEWYRPLAVTAGVLAMAIGTTLVVLIILAGLGWL